MGLPLFHALDASSTTVAETSARRLSAPGAGPMPAHLEPTTVATLDRRFPGCWPGRRCSGRRCPRRRSPHPTRADVPQQVVAHGIDPKSAVSSPGEIGSRSSGHLLPAEEQPTVDLDVGRRIDAGRHAHGRPPDAVERMISFPMRWWTAGDHASNPVRPGRSRWPSGVDEGVVPDVVDVLLVPRDPHVPVDRRPGDGDVPEPPPDEAESLVALALRNHCAGVGFVPLDEPLLEVAQSEEGFSSSRCSTAYGGSGTACRRGGRPRRSTARRARSTGHGRSPRRCSSFS